MRDMFFIDSKGDVPGVFSGLCFACFGHESCCCSRLSQAVFQGHALLGVRFSNVFCTCRCSGFSEAVWRTLNVLFLSHRGEIRVDEECCGRDGCPSHPEGHQRWR